MSLFFSFASAVDFAGRYHQIIHFQGFSLFSGVFNFWGYGRGVLPDCFFFIINNCHLTHIFTLYIEFTYFMHPSISFFSHPPALPLNKLMVGPLLLLLLMAKIVYRFGPVSDDDKTKPNIQATEYESSSSSNSSSNNSSDYWLFFAIISITLF